MAKKPRILIIAGPNGAGKTTFFRRLMAARERPVPFLNADEIAAQMNPGDPDAVAVPAGKAMLFRMQELIAQRAVFAFETTLAGRSYARKILRWQTSGYEVTLHFLRIPSAELCIRRVANRVEQGGHNIPVDVIRRRHAAGWENLLHLYRDIVDRWYWYNKRGRPANTDGEGKSRMSFETDTSRTHAQSATDEDHNPFNQAALDEAMQGAVELAKQKARETNTPIIVTVDGEIVELWPDDDFTTPRPLSRRPASE